MALEDMMNGFRELGEVEVNVSARHVHLTQEAYTALTGKADLTWDRDLKQHGQYLAKERVTIRKGDREFKDVAILGPFRPYCQVEIAGTDAIKLRMYEDRMLRHSGDIENTPGMTLVHGDNTYEMENGVIVPLAHVHMPDDIAEKYGVKDGDQIKLYIAPPREALIDVKVRTGLATSVYYEAHVDTDEGNAAAIKVSGTGKLVLPQ